VFKGGWVFTFNEQVSCRCPSHLSTTLEGAVQAKELMAFLQKFNGAEVILHPHAKPGILLLQGFQEKARLVLEPKVDLALWAVEKAQTWTPLPPQFAEGLELVAAVAGNKINRLTQYVHFKADGLEALDTFQVARYTLKLDTPESVLVKAEHVKKVLELGVSEWSVTEGWAHFRNPESKVTIACRRFPDDFPEVGPFLTMPKNSVKVRLPKGLEDAAAKAQIIVDKGDETDHVRVRISPHGGGKVLLRGEGRRGGYEAETPLPGYKGPALEFLIKPELLATIVKKFHEVQVCPERMKVEGGGAFQYAAALSPPEDKE
jgi:hypothetical protein